MFVRAQDEFALQAPSLLMDQASANLSNTITGRSNSSSCASNNLPAAPPMPATKPPVQQEPEIPKSAPSVNRRKDSFLHPAFLWTSSCCSLL